MWQNHDTITKCTGAEGSRNFDCPSSSAHSDIALYMSLWHLTLTEMQLPQLE